MIISIALGIILGYLGIIYITKHREKIDGFLSKAWKVLKVVLIVLASWIAFGLLFLIANP